MPEAEITGPSPEGGPAPAATERKSSRSGGHPWLAALALLLGLLLGANAVYPVLVVVPRTAAATIYVALTAGFATIAVRSVRQCRRLVLILVAILAVTVACLALLTGAATLLFRGMEVVSRTDTPGWGTIVTYRVNGGATTSYARWIRHERQILPGFLLVTSTSIDSYPPT